MKLLDEPGDHAIGRSHGGLTTKIHHLCDAKMRPLVILLGPGQGGDSPMFPNLPEALKVPRPGGGRARSRPDRALADRAYSSRANRELLRRLGIQAVIPERSDQEANRKRRGSKGAGPSVWTRMPANAGTSSRGPSTYSSNGAGSPPDTTSSPSHTAAEPSFARSPSGSKN
jgi:transposase